MATGSNPLMSAIAPLLMAKLAGGGGMPGGGGPGAGPGGPGTGPAGTPSDMASSAAYGRELSSARQADPAALGQKITAVKQAIGELISQTMMSNGGVARALSKTLQGLDAAIKEEAMAQATLQVAQPINSSAATGAPGASGGAGPAPVGVPGGGQF